MGWGKYTALFLGGIWTLLCACATEYLIEKGGRPGETASPQGLIRLELVQVIGSPGTGPGQFLNPRGISLDPAGNLYVADTDNDRVQKFDPQGRFELQVGGFGWSREQFNQPRDVGAENGLIVYVVDSLNERIQKFDRDLNYLSTISSNPHLEESLQFGRLAGIAVAPTGEIYVSDPENVRILKFDSFGRPERSFGGMGYGAGQVEEPSGLAVDAQGRVYVCDSGNGRVAVYDPFGGYLGSLGTGVLQSPQGVDVDPNGIIYVADAGGDQVLAFAPEGKLLLRFGTQGRGLGSFRSPGDLAVDGRGFLYVLDTGNGRVQKFRIIR